MFLPLSSEIVNHRQPHIPGAGTIADTTARIKYLREGEEAFFPISPFCLLFVMSCTAAIHQQMEVVYNTWYDSCGLWRHKQVTLRNFPNPYIFYSHAMPSVLKQASISSGPLISWQMKKKDWGFLMVLHIIQAPSRSRQAQPYKPILRHHWREIFTGQRLGKHTWS